MRHKFMAIGILALLLASSCGRTLSRMGLSGPQELVVPSSAIEVLSIALHTDPNNEGTTKDITFLMADCQILVQEYHDLHMFEGRMRLTQEDGRPFYQKSCLENQAHLE